MKYIIDTYREGCQWAGFNSAESLDEAKAQVLANFPEATEVDGYYRHGYRHVARFEIDSTDYADIYACN